MIWLAIALLAAACLAPVILAAWLGRVRIRSRRDMALALHRAQLAELDRDLAQNRLLESEHAAARLEVQRRLLGDAALTERETRRSGPVPLVIVCALAPAIALILYVAGGHPDYAAQRRASEAAASDEQTRKDDAVIAELRTMLAKMDPKSERARKGYLILGQAELTRGHLPEAADAWRMALAAKYEPALAAETAEIITESQGRPTQEAMTLFRRALADAPADAPWRPMVAKRVAEGGGS